MLALFLFVGAASALNIDNFIGSDSNFAAVSKSDFKCKSTGRFTNPDDCSGYILCRKMPDGTFDKSYGFCHGYAFNPKKGTCVPISPEVSCSGPGLADFANNKLFNTETVFCSRKGRFAEEGDCSSFKECLPSTDGLLIERRGVCPTGFAFNQRLQMCTRDPDCSPSRKGRSLEAPRRSDTQNDKLCEGGKGFNCLSCGTQIVCAEGKAHEKACETGLSCVNHDSLGAFCEIDKEVEDCKCADKSFGFKPDPYNKAGYFFCQGDTKPREDYTCAIGLVFNNKIQLCGRSDAIPPCTQAGVFAYSEDCNTYYFCQSSTTGFVQKIFKCDKDMFYDELTQECVDQCSIGTKKFECESEGRFRHPEDCRNYYECTSAGSEPRLQTCPRSYQWHQLSDVAGACSNPLTADCIPVKRTKCKRPASCDKSASSPEL